jgi:hypothetical protein
MIWSLQQVVSTYGRKLRQSFEYDYNLLVRVGKQQLETMASKLPKPFRYNIPQPTATSVAWGED